MTMKQIYIESPESEAKYKALSKQGLELKIPVFEQFIAFELFDKEGNHMLNVKRRSHSWLRNAYNMLVTRLCGVALNGGALYQAGNINVVQTNGSIFNQSKELNWGKEFPETLGNCGFRANIGDSTYGIQVGSGNAEESFEQYSLETLIAHGTGAGQISYGAMEAPAETYETVSKTYSILHKRFFNNNSGSDITVHEIGLVGKHDNSYEKVMYTRDLATIIVPVTAQLAVSYTLAVQFPY